MNFNLKTNSINSNQFVRAIAITLIVANHSSWLSMGGGVNFLMLLSGFNLAAFTFHKNDTAIINDMFTLTKKIITPSLIIIALSFLIKHEFVWQEIMLISNFYFPGKVAFMPIWYPQIMIQMVIIFSLVFLLLKPANKLKKSPIITTAIIFLTTLTINIVCRWLWDTWYLYDRLPHLLLWNFTLGWLIWALLKNPNFSSKAICSLVVIFTSSITFLALEHQSVIRFCIFNFLSLSFIWIDKIYLHPFIVRGLLIISSATFFIFLFHQSFIALFYQLTDIEIENYKLGVILKFLFTMVSSTILWLLYTASVNAYRKTAVQFKKQQNN